MEGWDRQPRRQRTLKPAGALKLARSAEEANEGRRVKEQKESTNHKKEEGCPRVCVSSSGILLITCVCT